MQDDTRRGECTLQQKIFWIIYLILSTAISFMVSFMWSLILSIPLIVISWWIAYRSGWFE